MRNLLLVVLLVSAGCAARGQQVYDRIQAAQRDGLARMDACYREALAGPNFDLISDKLAPDPDLALQSDRSIATPDEAAAIMALHESTKRCRAIWIAMGEQVSPTYAALLRQSFARGDANTARLVSGKITWGEWAMAQATEKADRAAKLTAERAAVYQGLATADAAEKERRAAAWQRAAIAGAMINASMPRQTNCTRFGDTINCTTW